MFKVGVQAPNNINNLSEVTPRVNATWNGLLTRCWSFINKTKNLMQYLEIGLSVRHKIIC